MFQSINKRLKDVRAVIRDTSVRIDTYNPGYKSLTIIFQAIIFYQKFFSL